MTDVPQSDEVFSHWFEQRWQELIAICDGDEDKARRLLSDYMFERMQNDPEFQKQYRAEIERRSREAMGWD